SPSGVSESLRVVRCKSRVPKRASSADSRALTTDLETPSLPAAAVNERASTTRANRTMESTSEAEAAMIVLYTEQSVRVNRSFRSSAPGLFIGAGQLTHPCEVSHAYSVRHFGFPGFGIPARGAGDRDRRPRRAEGLRLVRRLRLRRHHAVLHEH